MIHVTRNDGVPDYVLRAAQELVTKIAQHVEVKHRVTVELVTAVAYPSYRRNLVVGQFFEDGATIYVCGLRDKGTTAREWLTGFADTLVHEFVHYEQWRDTGETTERGVKVRTRALLKKMGL